MFPIRDDNPSPRFPFMVLVLIAANVGVYVFQWWTLDPGQFEVFMKTFAMIPARDFRLGMAGGWPDIHALPFVSSLFLHGGFFHLVANMWSFWIFGDNVEGRMGPLRFLFFYLACGLAASLSHAYWSPASAVPVVGASGAISGVMGAYLYLFPRARIHMMALLIFYPVFFDVPAVVFLAIWFLGQIMSGASALVTAGSAQDVGGIAFFAHIGGFVAGLALLSVFLPFSSPKRQKNRGA